jgi:dienelactone hydrolase
MSFRLDDAFNAMALLRRHAKVDGSNIFLVGQSHGAIVALRSALALGKTERFRAVAAFYPSCHALHNIVGLNSPLIVFAGGRDDWTPPFSCTPAKSIERSPSAEFELIVYPNAFHAFDQPRAATKYKGYKLVYDAQATADSQRKMTRFFTRHLKR